MVVRVNIFLLLLCNIGTNVDAQPCDTTIDALNFLHKQGFRLKDKFVLDDSSRFKAGLYLNKYIMPIIATGDTGEVQYQFLHFFKNGRCFLSSDYCKYPSYGDFEDQRFGWRGYYKIDGNLITLEYFDDWARYTFIKLAWNGDTLQELYSKSRGFWTAKDKGPILKKYTYILTNLSNTRAEW